MSTFNLLVYVVTWYQITYRLSEVAGMKVFENNPNVQDLSDTKRPMKLVEAFGELYDNEWTDALEDLLKKQIPERQAIENLKDILKV